MSIPDSVTTGITTGVVLSVVNQAAKQAQDFLAAATKHPGESIGTMLGNMLQRRIANAEGILSEAHFTLLNIGVTGKEIPFNVLQPALEGASNAEEPDIRTRWANLLANAADPRQTSPVVAMYPAILKELSSRDAKLLDAIHKSAEREVSNPADNRLITEAQFKAEDFLRLYCEAGLSAFPNLRRASQAFADANRPTLQAEERNFGLSLDILTRNRLIEENYKTKSNHHTDFAIGNVLATDVAVVGVFSLTDLGVGFVEACSSPKPKHG